jgi:nucleotide-binding universal stress UspA family protein
VYSHILIAVDGSDEATRAARHGLALAALFDASVDVVHVVERRALRLARGDEADRLRERGETALAAVEAAATDRGQSVDSTRREGRPAAEIAAFADDRDADLVVVGRQGATGLGKRLLGGVTEGLLGRSSVPVLVVPDAADAPAYDRVLLPTDGSDRAEAAIPHAAAVADRAGGAVHALNVVDLQAAGGWFSAGGLDAAFVERLEAEGREAVERAAVGLHESVPDLPVEERVVQTASFAGVAAGLREYVAEEGVDLVTMGSHGRSNLARTVLGSVASTTLRTVDVPVLVVPRAA